MIEILIVDDERVIRATLKDALEYEGYKIETAADGAAALDIISKRKFDAIICDIKMEGMDGIEFLDHMAKIEDSMSIPIIMISGHGNVSIAVDCIKKGAFDFIEKPIELNILLNKVRNAVDKKEHVVQAKKEIKQKSSATLQASHEIIGSSSGIKKIKLLIDKVAPSEARVLVTGSNGTGKELVARSVHRLSHRSSGPFVEVNCAAIPSELIESELFGHEKGSFTSADRQRKGKFEQANGGTIFLDEIGDMSLSAQAKVLRVLQEGRISRVGAEKDVELNVRVISATNKNLRHEIELGNFREDLFHRLSAVILHVPALKDRKDDIPELVSHFMAITCKREGVKPIKISDDAMRLLQEQQWSGNVRELLNIVERLVVFTKDENNDNVEITTDDVETYVIAMGNN